MPDTVRIESQYEVAAPRERIWPILSQTDWLNRSLGLPPVSYAFTARPEGGADVWARAAVAGVDLRWHELPFEWSEPEFYRVRRVFNGGLFAEANVGIQLREVSAGATRVTAFSELTPRSVWGRFLARQVLGPKAERRFRQITDHLQAFLSGAEQLALPRLPAHPADESALAVGMTKLRDAGQSPDLITRLGEWLRTAADVELSHIRPIAVARAWRQEPWDVVRLFLHASRCGLLDLRWEVLCPNCRTASQGQAQSLTQLKREIHCDVCQIRFDAEFDRSVELKFAVNAAVRPRENRTFCLAGPGGRPHVVSQAYLLPGERRGWSVAKPSTPLRLRSPQVQAPIVLGEGQWPGPEHHCVVDCAPARFSLSFRGSGGEPAADFELSNPNEFAVQVLWERPEWSEDVLTAAAVTGWQDFRDLFAREVLSLDEQITVGSQVVLFTDLRASTALYRTLGDAVAYARVRDHFAVLSATVREYHGGLVKTIGDAVMAVFSRLDEALAAVREMHERLQAANTGSDREPLRLKSGLHVGPCLAVNANDRLDYFGTTINLAARIVECSQGGDLVVSDEVFQRAEMRSFLALPSRTVVSAEVNLRGFEQPHRVWRVSMT